jgi:hypothetical protein
MTAFPEGGYRYVFMRASRERAFLRLACLAAASTCDVLDFPSVAHPSKNCRKRDDEQSDNAQAENDREKKKKETHASNSLPGHRADQFSSPAKYASLIIALSANGRGLDENQGPVWQVRSKRDFRTCGGE